MRRRSRSSRCTPLGELHVTWTGPRAATSDDDDERGQAHEWGDEVDAGSTTGRSRIAPGPDRPSVEHAEPGRATSRRPQAAAGPGPLRQPRGDPAGRRRAGGRGGAGRRSSSGRADEVARGAAELAADYTDAGPRLRPARGRPAAGGSTPGRSAPPVVERFVLDGQEVRLTQAALETLAVVAYRQPVSRSRVSAVRGVNCDGVMRTLVLRGLVDEAGTDPETGAILYRTTSYFLERIGLRDLDELPALAPFLPDDVEDDRAELTRLSRRTETGTEPRLDDRARRPAAEGAGRGRASAAAGLRGADRRGPGRGRRRGRPQVRRRVDPAAARSSRSTASASRPAQDLVYLALNKPPGVLSTMSDPRGRPDARRLRRRPAGAALPRRPARLRHRGPAAAHQRR